MKTRLTLLLSIVALAVLSRLLPHPWNWTAVGAASLFAGAKFEKLPVALLVPLLTLLLSDLILGFHATMPFVYGAFAISVGVGWFFRDQLQGRRVAGASIALSLLFYFVTNLGVWLTSGFYPPTLEGLMLAYAAGLPFLANQVVGDLFYAGLLFGLWAFAEHRVPALARSSV